MVWWMQMQNLTKQTKTQHPGPGTHPVCTNLFTWYCSHIVCSWHAQHPKNRSTRKNKQTRLPPEWLRITMKKTNHMVNITMNNPGWIFSEEWKNNQHLAADHHPLVCWMSFFDIAIATTFHFAWDFFLRLNSWSKISLQVLWYKPKLMVQPSKFWGLYHNYDGGMRGVYHNSDVSESGLNPGNSFKNIWNPYPKGLKYKCTKRCWEHKSERNGKNFIVLHQNWAYTIIWYNPLKVMVQPSKFWGLYHNFFFVPYRGFFLWPSRWRG